MKRALITKSIFVLVPLFALCGCNELTQIATPTCSDEATLTLVRQIISENVVEASDQLPTDELKRRLTFNLAHATKLEENIHKYTCEATLVASNGTAEQRISLEYESQLDDARDHLVQVLNLTNGDVFLLKPILSAEKSITAEAPSAAPVAALVQPTEESELNAAAKDAAAIVDAADAADGSASQTPKDTLELIAQSIEGKPYTELRAKLLEAGYNVDDAADELEFPHAYEGTLANCVDNGCFVPFKGKGRNFCVFASGDDSDSSNWPAILMRIKGSSQLMSNCP